MEKLTKTAARLGTLFRVLQKIELVAMIVIVCVMTVLTIVNAVNPDAIIGEGLNIVALGALEIELALDYTPTNAAILGYAWISVGFGIAWGIVLYIGFGILRRLLEPMTEGNPFHPDTTRYIKKLAVLSLILGILDNIFSAVDTFCALQFFRLDRLMESGIIRRISVDYKLDLTFLVVFFVLLLVSYIFDYGTKLQKLDDETL